VIRAASRTGDLLLALAAMTLAAAPAASETKHWAPVSGKSQVAFVASFALGNFSGSSELIGGGFAADPTDLRLGVTGSLQINVTTLKTGADGRDRDLWKSLAADRYPEIRFTVERVEPSFPSVAERSDVLGTIFGHMAIHGVDRPMSFPGRVRWRDHGLWVRGEGELRMSDFGIVPPRKLFLQVEDIVRVSFDVQLGEDGANTSRSEGETRQLPEAISR
jgi:polyisoprenoid-binding protein YceI